VTDPRSLVSVVDDDESVRESLPDLVRSFGCDVDAFSSAEEFLASNAFDRTHCLILDIAMPGTSGPELQRELIQRERTSRSSSSPVTELKPTVRASSSSARWLV
jgi:FixJ family two-component response regulator